MKESSERTLETGKSFGLYVKRLLGKGHVPREGPSLRLLSPVTELVDAHNPSACLSLPWPLPSSVFFLLPHFPGTQMPGSELTGETQLPLGSVLCVRSLRTDPCGQG